MPTVLLVDDDDAVRGAVDDWLSTAGFDVIAASDTNKGLREIEARPEIDICIADLVMPAIVPDGAEFIRLLDGEKAGSAGDHDDRLLQRGREDRSRERSTLFYKPIDLDILAKARSGGCSRAEGKVASGGKGPLAHVR